jgi:hypothetical protein
MLFKARFAIIHKTLSLSTGEACISLSNDLWWCNWTINPLIPLWWRVWENARLRKELQWWVKNLNFWGGKKFFTAVSESKWNIHIFSLECFALVRKSFFKYLFFAVQTQKHFVRLLPSSGCVSSNWIESLSRWERAGRDDFNYSI